MKGLLETRERIKGKKPTFIRQDAHKKAEVSKKWRRPKGLHSKMRLRKRGYMRCVEVGWGSPKKIKNFDRSGLKVRLICSIKEIDDIDPKEEGAVVSKKLGLKKRILLLKKAEEKKVTVLNIKNITEYLKESEESIRKKREEKKKAKKDKKEKEGEKKETGIEKVMSDEEKKKDDKKEKDRILTKKV